MVGSVAAKASLYNLGLAQFRWSELRKKFEAIGADARTPLVSYCMIGMRASVTYFVARHLGYDARMYDGSIVDWTRRKLPAVMGK